MTICQHLGLVPEQTFFSDLAAASKTNTVRMVACTVGNWGRATARMARLLGIQAAVYVPDFTTRHTKDLIAGEGAELVSINGSYDDALAAAQLEGRTPGTLLVQDLSWDGYTDVPRWATEGYNTMLTEADRQVATATRGKVPTVVSTGIGGGLWAEAVVTHYKAENPATRVVSVEADTAAGFKESLHCGENTTVATSNTIMAGLNGGMTDETAWPLLRDGIDIAMAITNRECDTSVKYLQSQGVNAGPCGGATLAALHKLCSESDLPDKSSTIVVLFSTEGHREYESPI